MGPLRNSESIGPGAYGDEAARDASAAGTVETPGSQHAVTAIANEARGKTRQVGLMTPAPVGRTVVN
jgi:hypothetical protein